MTPQKWAENMNRKAKIQCLDSNSPQAGKIVSSRRQEPSRDLEGQEPKKQDQRGGDRTPCWVEIGDPRGQGVAPHAGGILTGRIFQDVMHVHCSIAGSRACPLNGGLLDWAPAHSRSESPLIGPLTLLGPSRSTPTWEQWLDILATCWIPAGNCLLPGSVLLAVGVVDIH